MRGFGLEKRIPEEHANSGLRAGQLKQSLHQCAAQVGGINNKENKWFFFLSTYNTDFVDFQQKRSDNTVIGRGIRWCTKAGINVTYPSKHPFSHSPVVSANQPAIQLLSIQVCAHMLSAWNWLETYYQHKHLAKWAKLAGIKSFNWCDVFLSKFNSEIYLLFV